MQDVHHHHVAVALLHLQHQDATLAVQYLLQHPPEAVAAPECNAETVHAWEAQRVAAGHEDPLEPASTPGRTALKIARAFCRERQLFTWVREQNVQKGLAPSNAAVWREHITAGDATNTRATAAPAHARTLRSRNQWIARWSRRWNIRRGFFKPGERLPLETRRTKAAFPCPCEQTRKKGDPKNGPQKRPA